MEDLKWDVDNWNNTIRSTTLQVIDEIPGPGPAISTVLSMFWPADQASTKSIFNKIRQQTAKMIDKAILEQWMRDRNADVKNIRHLMAQYQRTKIKSDKRTLLLNAITRADKLLDDIEGSKHGKDILPFAVTTAYLNFILIREKYLYQDKDSKLWLDTLYDQMGRYEKYFTKNIEAWLQWRHKNITHGRSRNIIIDKIAKRKITFQVPHHFSDEYHQFHRRFPRMQRECDRYLRNLIDYDLVQILSSLWDIHSMTPRTKGKKTPLNIFTRLKSLTVGPINNCTQGRFLSQNFRNLVFHTSIREESKNLKNIELVTSDRNDLLTIEFSDGKDKIKFGHLGNAYRKEQCPVPKGTNLCALDLYLAPDWNRNDRPHHPCGMVDSYIQGIGIGLSTESQIKNFGYPHGNKVSIRMPVSYRLVGAHITQFRACAFKFNYLAPPKPRRAKRKG